MRVTRKKANRIRREKAFDTLAVSIRFLFWHINVDTSREWSIIFNPIMMKQYFFRAIFNPVRVVKWEFKSIQ